MVEMSRDAILKLIERGESTTVEFKERLASDALVARSLSALANSGGGVLIVGVDRNSRAIGLSGHEAASTLSRLVSIASSLLPAPHKGGIIEIDSNRNLAYLIVDAVPSYLGEVATAAGESYVRKGTSDVLAPRVAQHSKPKAAPKIIALAAMSFRDEEEPALADYFGAMKRAVERSELPIELTRVDLQEGDYEVSQEVMDAIERAQVLTLTSP